MKLRDWLLGLLSVATLLSLLVVANNDRLRDGVLILIFEDRPGLQLFALGLFYWFIGYQFGLDAGLNRKDDK